MTLEQRPEEYERGSWPCGCRGNDVPDRMKSRCKSPEARVDWEDPRKSREASMAGKD